MSNRIKMHEYSDGKGSSFLHQIEKLNMDLLALQGWRRRGLSSQIKIRAVDRFIAHYRNLEQNETNTSPASAAALASLAEDYNYIGLNIDECAKRLESMLPVVTSLVQVIDSRRSFQETANIRRLTVLALVFVPLTFVASIFSMNNGTGPGEANFWQYFAVAIPLSGLVFLVATPPFKLFQRLYAKLTRRQNSEDLEAQQRDRFRLEKSGTTYTTI